MSYAVFELSQRILATYTILYNEKILYHVYTVNSYVQYMANYIPERPP